MLWSGVYDAFGMADVDAASVVENNLRFPGQYYDAESGLHYNWHRYYDPSTGRYLTPDPIGLNGGMNLYLYADANPSNRIDPFGLSTSICRRPLKGSKKKGRIKYHEYSCVTNPATGKTTCSSNTPTGFPLYSPGRPTTSQDGDVYDPDQCTEVEPDDTCMDQCMEDNVSSSDRPQYGWPGPGTDCKEYSRDLVENCRRKCFLMNDYRKGL